MLLYESSALPYIGGGILTWLAGGRVHHFAQFEHCKESKTARESEPLWANTDFLVVTTLTKS